MNAAAPSCGPCLTAALVTDWRWTKTQTGSHRHRQTRLRWERSSKNTRIGRRRNNVKTERSPNGRTMFWSQTQTCSGVNAFHRTRVGPQWPHGFIRPSVWLGNYFQPLFFFCEFLWRSGSCKLTFSCFRLACCLLVSFILINKNVTLSNTTLNKTQNSFLLLNLHWFLANI